LPFIRIYAEGFPWLAIFLVLTGFVNSLKPIQQARADKTASSLAGLASSAFRRTLRLVLPCTIATIISWTIVQCGGYSIGKMVDSEWMNNTCGAAPSGSFFGAIYDLIRAVFRTWAYMDNEYDRNQWAMSWFLKGNMVLYVTLLATVRAQPRHRMLIFLALFLYSCKMCDGKVTSPNEHQSWLTFIGLVGVPIFGGALLCELSMEPIISKFSTSRSMIRRALPFSMVFVAWYLIGYSGVHSEWAHWSNSLLQIGIKLFPEGAEIVSFWSLTGVLLLIAAIVLSSTLQRILSHPALLRLGTMSFPIYLLHGPLLRSFLNWMLFAYAKPIWYEDKNEEDMVVRIYPQLPIPPLWKFILTIPIFFAVVLYLSMLWVQHIEPWCAQITKCAEDTICGNATKSEESQTIMEKLANGNGSPEGLILPI
jgi:peptidoglycan/LPS O-acetylase OafA/YrhL